MDFKVNNNEANTLFLSIKRAKEEWLEAQIYFNNVSDPDLIDYAIYNMDAAEKKYVYLMKKAREMQERVKCNA